MNFLAMLIALALQQLVPHDSALQSRGWVLYLYGAVSRAIGSATGSLVITLSVVSLGGYWILEQAEGQLFGLPTLLLSAGMLLWSVGSDDYHTALERYDARRESDPDAALDCLDRLWMPQEPSADVSASGLSAGDGSDSNRVAEEDLAHRHLLYSGYARWFAPVLYFAVFGPLAAVLYRCVAIIASEGSGAFSLRVLALFDWFPARLVVLTFAVTGDFLEVMERLGRDHLWRSASAPDLLGAAARAACSNAPGPRVGADLLYRSSGFWLITLSLLYLLV